MVGKLRGSAGGSAQGTDEALRRGSEGGSAPPWTRHPRIRAPGAAGGSALLRQELARGVPAQAALDVGVAVAQGAAPGAVQRHLPLAGSLLLAAGAPVVQALGLGRVPGGGPE